MHFLGIAACQQREIAGNHQPLDMVGISMFQRLADGLRKAVHVSLSGPVKGWKRAVRAQFVAVHIIRPGKPIDTAYIFAPPDYLPDEALGGIDRHLASAVPGFDFAA